MKKIGVYIKQSLFRSEELHKAIKEVGTYDGVELYCSPEQEILFGGVLKAFSESDKLYCLLAFGGDGTILSAVRQSIMTGAPILGINMGKLGFLSDFSFSDFPKYVDRLLEGDFQTIERMMIKTQVFRKRRKIYQGYALNDAVIFKGLVSRLIDIRLRCSGNFVLQARCDGMIAATPTGSTAYSLSAGGPILTPEMEALIIAPLCPHVLSVRPMVFPHSARLVFKMEKVYNETMLQLDGKSVQPLIDGDTIRVKAASKKVSFITVTGKSFYQTLRKKLHMARQ